MPPSLPALGLQGGVTQDPAQLRDPRAWAATSPQGNSDCTKRPKAGRGGGERTAAPSPAPAQVGRQRTRTEGGNSEHRGSQPRDPWAAAVRRRQGPTLGSRGTGDRHRFAHLLLRAGELLLYIAGDLPRRHPLTAHLCHRGAGLARWRGPFLALGGRARRAPSPQPRPRVGPRLLSTPLTSQRSRLTEAERALG